MEHMKKRCGPKPVPMKNMKEMYAKRVERVAGNCKYKVAGKRK